MELHLFFNFLLPSTPSHTLSLFVLISCFFLLRQPSSCSPKKKTLSHCLVAGGLLLLVEPPSQILFHANSLPVQQLKALMQVNSSESSAVVVRDDVHNAGFAQAESIVQYSKRLEDDLHMIGMKIKQHEDNIRFLNSQKNKLDDSILDVQVTVGKYHSANANKAENEDHLHRQTEEEIVEQILQYEKSAAGVLCQLKARHGTQAANLPMIQDVMGIVAMLGKVDDDNLSRLLSEYLGMEYMLAIVCKTFEGVRALEVYDKEGCINKSTGLHGLGASIGRALEGRFHVFCLENLRPYVGDFIPDDPQRRLDLLKPRLANGECPPGFLGFAVNMINLDVSNLFCVTARGRGLRETLFYNLFSRLQVYQTRADMLHALPCISDGAISLDGGMIRATGVFSLGNRQDVGVKFPRSSTALSLSESFMASERQIQELKWKKEKMLEDIKREQAVLDNAKLKFDKKKQEFIKFLVDSSSYVSQQHQMHVAQSSLAPR